LAGDDLVIEEVLLGNFCESREASNGVKVGVFDEFGEAELGWLIPADYVEVLAAAVTESFGGELGIGD
jgi:hypothetical protein